MNRIFLPLAGVALLLNAPSYAQTTIKLSPNADTEIDQGGGASSYLGANSAFTISPWTTASASKRAVIRFNLSGFSSGCTINSAWLILQEYNTQGTSRQINVHRLTTNWTEGGTNWPSPWSAGGGDYAATAVGSFTPSWTGVIKQDSVNLTTSVQAIVTGTYSNYGWLLKIASEDATQQYWAFYSKESTTAAYRPFLRVRYSGCTVLPVELLNFSAALENNSQVLLNWQTASETNNDFFTIERSEDATSWEKIKQIDGAGNSKSLLTYHFVDEPTLVKNLYYRLKQTDFDGKFSYSGIQSVAMDPDKTVQSSIYPNPTDHEVTIVATEVALSQLKIFNVTGQDVTAQTAETVNVSNERTISLENLTSGIYYIQVGSNFNKLLKQ
jgi:hypothetical protein